jgi:UDP-N-acetylglucosamine diphosphorylase / glucose-1-phosphate thymidylyltransferase / UDP-N-acetylgalactosamine diphosphorylase / glucosamine-1-phosphate N-acetyltransferase / galactosamine-1-phosphate N-acetyltransferase
VKVVFLCGGIGKRMFPVNEDKFLLKFLGKPLLVHQIEMAMKAGLNDFVFICNRQNVDKISSIVGGISGITASYALQNQSLGIANALKSAEPNLSKEIMVVNPNDVFEQLAFDSIMHEYKKNGAISYLLGYEVDDYFPGGYMVINDSSELVDIIEKPGKGNEPSNLVNIVVHIHTDSSKLLRYLDNVETNDDNVYEMAMGLMARDGSKIKVVPYKGSWAAIKYPWNIISIVEQFLDSCDGSISDSAEISTKATVDGKVIIEDGVRILEGAVVRGPCYIGKNSIIGNNALLRDGCHVGSNCVVGFCTEVKHSYIDDDCWFHSNYVGDSILGKGCSLGAGTVTANWRFDEKNVSIKVGDDVIDTNHGKFGMIMGGGCKTGINVSIMPGVRIGANAVVGPHVNLIDDLDPNKIIVAETQYRTINRKTLGI